MGLFDESCSSDQPAVLRDKRLKRWTLHPKFLFKKSSYLPCLGTLDFYRWIILSMTLTFGLGSQGICKAKLHFLAHFSVGQNKNLCHVEAIQIEHHDTNFQQDLV